MATIPTKPYGETGGRSASKGNLPCSKAGIVGDLLGQGIETLVKKSFPDITEVVDLTDHDSGDSPYM